MNQERGIENKHRSEENKLLLRTLKQKEEWNAYYGVATQFLVYSRREKSWQLKTGNRNHI